MEFLSTGLIDIEITGDGTCIDSCKQYIKQQFMEKFNGLEMYNVYVITIGGCFRPDRGCSFCLYQFCSIIYLTLTFMTALNYKKDNKTREFPVKYTSQTTLAYK